MTADPKNWTSSSALVFQGHRSGDGQETAVYAVAAGSAPVLLDWRLDLRNHSPTGLEWGYLGSGPAQLSLAMCARVVGDDRAIKVYQRVKERIIATLPRNEGWEIPASAVADAVAQAEADLGIPTAQ